MSEGILLDSPVVPPPPQYQQQMATSTTSPNSVTMIVSEETHGRAGIFVEQTGNRKMFMSAGRLVLPRLFRPGTRENSRPLEEQNADMLLQHSDYGNNNNPYEEDSPEETPGSFFSSVPDQDRRQQDQQQQQQQAILTTCSRCGLSQHWVQDGPFHCVQCVQTGVAPLQQPARSLQEMESDMLRSSQLSRDLPPVEESSGDRSEEEEDDAVQSPATAEGSNNKGGIRRISGLMRRLRGSGSSDDMMTMTPEKQYP